MERVNVRRLPDDWGADEEALLQAIDDATATSIYIAYNLAAAWFDEVAGVIDELEASTRLPPAIALDLAEHLIARLDGARVDDSDSGLVEAFERIERLHARARVGGGRGPRGTRRPNR